MCNETFLGSILQILQFLYEPSLHVTQHLGQAQKLTATPKMVSPTSPTSSIRKLHLLYQILSNPAGGNRTPRTVFRWPCAGSQGASEMAAHRLLSNNPQVENATFNQHAPFSVFSILKPDFRHFLQGQGIPLLVRLSGGSGSCACDQAPNRKEGSPSLPPARTQHPQGLSILC